MQRPWILLGSLVLLLVGACETGYSAAARGRQLVIGMDTETLQACAGIPTRTRRLDAQTELYSYEIKYEHGGGGQVTLPIIGGGFSLGGSGAYCHAIVRIVGGKVVDVVYTGDNDEMLGRDGICAPIFRGCLRAHGKQQKEARSANRTP
jgi:hypothetical protein